MQLLRKIAFPISLLYAIVVHFRNYLFDIGVFKSKSFKTPIISVGNLSVGGTGKTPMVEFLISMLKNEYSTAVLSRGYKRKSKGFILATYESTVEQLGDEPYQICSKFPDITMAVDVDRRNGISILEDRIKPDVILLDDAYQHRKVKPGFSILLTAYNNLYCNDWYLPTGDLRDSRKEAKRADLIIVTKCPPELTIKEQSLIKKKLKPKAHQEVLFSYMAYDSIVSGSDSDVSLIDLRNKEITLVTGIADPKPLALFLDKQGISFEHLSFEDHHFFTEKELELFDSKEFILTTEKDYVRLKGKVIGVRYILVKHLFLNKGGELIKDTLRDFMKQSS